MNSNTNPGEEKRPFIIWTLQRTGGTNLASRLFDRSSYSKVQHEPFNRGRIFWPITERWLETRDAAQLSREIEEICRRGVLIKHCIEVIPFEITNVLIERSLAAGYRHLVLHRRNAAARLLSLHFAKKTGYWGLANRQAAKIDRVVDSLGDEIEPLLDEDLPVKDLVALEGECVRRLKVVWQKLVDGGATPMPVAYEDIYGADMKDAKNKVISIMKYLRLTGGKAEDDALVESIIKKGDQGTRDVYARLPGADKLVKAMENTPKFMPEATLKRLVVAPCATRPSWVLSATIDNFPPVAEESGFHIGGVVVLGKDAPVNCELRWDSQAGEQPIKWDIASPRMKQLFPDSANGQHARFEADIKMMGQEKLCLALVGGDESRFPLLELWSMGASQGAPDFTVVHKEPEDRVIFDVGACDGQDSWFYLQKGFRVVAVEANPQLAELLRSKFAAQVKAGRYFVENVAIADQPGKAAFFVNEAVSEWSSMIKASKATLDRFKEIVVPADTLGALMSKYDRPYYIKIDIEGGELAAIRSLQAIGPQKTPPLVSFEVNPNWATVLEMLRDLGYTKFQLVRQGAAFVPPLPPRNLEGVDTALIEFRDSMSGPFGRDLPFDKWVGVVEMSRQVTNAQHDQNARRREGKKPGWYDVHAAQDEWFKATYGSQA